MEKRVAIKISIQIQNEIREYLKEEDCNKQYGSYNSLIIDYPYVDLITQDNVKDNLENNSEYEELYEKILEILNSKMDKINIIDKAKKIQDDEFDEYEYRAGDYNYYQEANYTEFDNINDYINELIEVNIKIKDAHFPIDSQNIKERDRLIEIILFHKTFAIAVQKLSIETMRYYKSLHNNSSYDCESYEIVFKELARDILKKMKPEYKIENPEAYTYSYLFKKNSFANNNMSPIDSAFSDWVKTANSKKDILVKGQFLISENLGVIMPFSDEGEYNNTYTVALDSAALGIDEFEEIDRLIDLEDEIEEIKRKGKVTYYYKGYNIKDNLFYENYTERWEDFLRDLIFDCRYNNQQKIIKYYYYGNYSFNKISKIVGMDITNVRRNHLKAIQTAKYKIINSDFYKAFPNTELIMECNDGFWGVRLNYVYKIEPYSPLIIAIEREKMKELKQVI